MTDLKPGDAVACSGSQCAHHAELVAVPRNLCTPVPAGVDLDEAAFVTLGTIAMQALRLTNTTFGSTVVMYGLGLLGLLATQIAAASGIYIIGLDIDPRRLEEARTYGALRALDPRGGAAKKAVMELDERGLGPTASSSASSPIWTSCRRTRSRSAARRALSSGSARSARTSTETRWSGTTSRSSWSNT